MSIKFWKNLNLTQIFDFSHFLSIFSTFPEKITKKISFSAFFTQIFEDFNLTFKHLGGSPEDSESIYEKLRICLSSLQTKKRP